MDMTIEGDNYNFSCDPRYMSQENVTSENTESGSGGLPSCTCVPLNCSADSLPVPANAEVVPSCGSQNQSQYTVLCGEGFTGGNVTYLCNVTSDPAMVDWVAVDGVEMNHTCQRGLLLHLI